MECTDEQIGILLSDYFSGHLGSAESEMVRGHLAACQLCRESLQTMTILSPNGLSGQRSHPSKVVLAQYYHDRTRLTAEVSALMERHLAECRDCAAELAILNDMERELRSSVARPEHTGAKAQSLVGRYVAYAAAACLLIAVGYRVLVTEDSQREQSRVYQLAESTRAGGQMVEIRRDGGSQDVVLEAPFYHARAEYDYTATIIDVRGRQVGAKTDRLSFPASGRILAHVRLTDLPPGEYQLVITESRRDRSGQPSQSHYPFRLVNGTNPAGSSRRPPQKHPNCTDDPVVRACAVPQSWQVGFDAWHRRAAFWRLSTMTS